MNFFLGAFWTGVAVLIAVGMTCGCSAHCPASASGGEVPKIIVPPVNRPQHPLDCYVPGIENFGFVSAEVWRGARPTAQGYQSLREMRVGTIIDLELRCEAPPLPDGVHPVPLGVSEWHSDQVDTARLLELIRDNPKPIFIHCRLGRDRTGLAIAAYRLSQGMPIPDIIRELHNFRVDFWWAPFIEYQIGQVPSKSGSLGFP